MKKHIILSIATLSFYYVICCIISNSMYYKNWNDVSNFIFTAAEFGMFVYLMKSINNKSYEVKTTKTKTFRH